MSTTRIWLGLQSSLPIVCCHLQEQGSTSLAYYHCGRIHAIIFVNWQGYSTMIVPNSHSLLNTAITKVKGWQSCKGRQTFPLASWVCLTASAFLADDMRFL